MTKERIEAERLIYQVYDDCDKSGEQKEFWMKKFSKMSDAQFKSYISQDFPFYYQVGAFKEPKFIDTKHALENILKVPLLEQVYKPFKYKNKDGKPMRTKKCIVVPVYNKKMKQLVTKKTRTVLDNTSRDMRGQLVGQSKQARTSDHEFESFAISGLTNTEKEMSRARGDAMVDKEIMLNQIRTLGQVALADLPDDPADSLGKQNLSAYFIGAQLFTNLVMDDDYLTPYSKSLKQRKISRID